MIATPLGWYHIWARAASQRPRNIEGWYRFMYRGWRALARHNATIGLDCTFDTRAALRFKRLWQEAKEERCNIHP